jgi:hypothetical protein
VGPGQTLRKGVVGPGQTLRKGVVGQTLRKGGVGPGQTLRKGVVGQTLRKGVVGQRPEWDRGREWWSRKMEIRNERDIYRCTTDITKNNVQNTNVINPRGIYH